MKFKGFTLAEVLITMTIIGVVAALTTPALFHNAGTAQVGPKLAKIKSTIENANRQLMADEEVGRLSTLLTDIPNNSTIGQEYIRMLRTTMRLEEGASLQSITSYYNTAVDDSMQLFDANAENSANVSSNDIIRNTIYTTVEGANIGFVMQNLNDPWFIFVDINGINQPNRFGKDIFAFILNNDGMLTSYGDWGQNIAHSWQNLCNPANDTPVANVAVAGLACTATIFENNLRVTYDD